MPSSFTRPWHGAGRSCLEERYSDSARIWCMERQFSRLSRSHECGLSLTRHEQQRGMPSVVTEFFRVCRGCRSAPTATDKRRGGAYAGLNAQRGMIRKGFFDSVYPVTT